MSLVTIKTSCVQMDLLILKSRLESEGIRCYLKNEITAQLMNYIPTFEIELQVPASDLEKAKHIMSEVNGY